MELLITFFLNLVFTFVIIKLAFKVQNPVRSFLPKTEHEKIKVSPFGGLGIFFSSVIVAIFFIKDIAILQLLIPTFLMLLLGLFDDIKKVLSKKFNGISAKVKLLMQSLITALTCFICFKYNANFESIKFIVPFYGILEGNIGVILSLFVAYFAFTGTVNAVNLTDGLDGLAGKQVLLILAFLVAVITAVHFDGLKISVPDLKIILMCFIGGILAFLVFNSNPAKIFMGDAGSMMLGSLISTIFILLKLEFVIIFVGFIIFMEAFSVMLQVAYFKATKGKRIFKMSPIHHHFQLSGVKEQKITETAFIATLILVILFLTPFF